MKKFIYQRINAIKYLIKRNISEEELNKCNRLAHGGYVSWNTYTKVVHKEVQTRIRKEGSIFI